MLFNFFLSNFLMLRIFFFFFKDTFLKIQRKRKDIKKLGKMTQDTFEIIDRITMEMNRWEMTMEMKNGKYNRTDCKKKYLLLLQEVTVRYISIPMNTSCSFLRIPYKQNNIFLMGKLSEQNFETVGQTNTIILLCMK